MKQGNRDCNFDKSNELKVKPPSHLPIWLANIAGFASENISKISKKNPIISREKVKILTTDNDYNILKAKKELNYQPKVDIKKGVKQTINWYTKNRYL